MSVPGDPPLDREDAGSPLFLRRLAPLAALLGALVLAGLAASVAWRQYDDSRQRALKDLQAKILLTNVALQTAFQGYEVTLNAIAASQVVTAHDEQAMTAFFRRVEPRGGVDPFTAGLFWVDRKGIARASSNRPPSAAGTDVSDRSYFREVMKTGKPYVSEGLIARGSAGRRIVTIAVPTHDADGGVSGVLGGAILINPTTAAGNSALAQLGLQGVSAFDRAGQDLFAGFSHAKNAALLSHIRSGSGFLANTRGLDGKPEHAVVYANIPSAGWTVAVDRSRSSLFASGRRALVLEWSLIAGVSVLLTVVAALFFVRARREAGRRRVREQLRSDLARTLGATRAVSEVADAVASALGSAFPAALGVIAFTAGDDERLRVSASSAGPLLQGLAENADVLVRVGDVADPAVRVVAVETRAAIRQRLPELEGAAGSVYLLPLVTRTGRRAGVLVLLFGTDHGLDADEQSLIASHAEQAARALERAQVQEREHAVAVTLQRALLAESLPEIDSLDLAARYEAGSAGLEVGGDWYDVVVRPDGMVLAIVGDVAGRGITAATLMGRLRSAFQAYAYDFVSPAEVLRRLVRHVARDEMATAVVLAFDPFTREVTYSSAGHLPPVLVDVASGETTLLEAAGGPPLGAVPLSEVSLREATVALPGRAALIAYTDGLIERRTESIDRGIDLVRSVMGATTTLGADRVAGRVLAEAAAREGGEDDVALLVIRSVELPRRMDVEIPADAGSLRVTRRRMHAWLALQGLGEQQRTDAVLAVSEACNNAIEHAYREGAGTIALCLEVVDGVLRMQVEDRGLWRLDGDRSIERGRGLPIMRGVMDSVQIERGSNGTRVRFERRLDLPGPPLARVPE